MEKYEDLIKLSKHDLINSIYNNWIAARQYKYLIAVGKNCDFYCSSFAYLSSYWRCIDFVKKRVPISKEEFRPGEYRTGVFACTRRSLPTRLMTEQEFRNYIDFIDRAIDKELLGWRECNKILRDLYRWMQTLEIEDN